MTVARIADGLVEQGFLQREFFDRLFMCDRCQSHRLHVREECASCRSADLSEVGIIHHLRCAYQGPADDFTKDGSLVCPKCRIELRHYGSDHETAGTTMRCAACGFSGAEPIPAFVCLDCGTRTDADRVGARSYYHYDVTPDGLRHLLEPAAGSHPVGVKLLAAGCPVEVVRRARSLYRPDRDFVIAEVSYPGAAAVRTAHGEDTVERARKELQSALAARLQRDSIMVRHGDFDYAVVANTGKKKVEADLAATLSTHRKKLSVDLAPEIRAYDREDLIW
jgi:hypothetical protein